MNVGKWGWMGGGGGGGVRGGVGGGRGGEWGWVHYLIMPILICRIQWWCSIFQKSLFVFLMLLE